MRRSAFAITIMLTASAATASDAIVRLSGWAEIPSTYRHPGPVSGQFTTPSNGVTPPYQGQPIPGFSGMIPSPTPGRFIALPDNGFGAQGNSADFVLGVYEVTPDFKTVGDGTTSRGPVAVNSHTPFSDPNGLLNASVHHGWTGLQSHHLLFQQRDPGGSGDPEPQAVDGCRFRRRVDRAHGRWHVLGG